MLATELSCGEFLLRGGKPGRVDLAPPMDFVHLHNVRVHPDGRRIAFTVHTYRSQRSEVWAMENFLPELSSTD